MPTNRILKNDRTKMTGDELADLEYYLARRLFSWFRPDYRTEVSSKVTAFIDLVALQSEGARLPNARTIDPAHSYSQATPANQVASIAIASNFNNREVALFTGAQAYASSLAAANWTFAHQGIAFQAWGLSAPTTMGVNSIMFGTSAAGSTNGVDMYTHTAANVGSAFVASPGIVYTAAGGSVSLNVPTYFDLTIVAGSNNAKFLQKSTVVNIGTLSSTTSNPPSTTMTIGASSPAVTTPARAAVADVMFASVVDSYLQDKVRRYFFLRYGQ